MTAPNIDPRDLEVLPVERASTIPAAWYTDPVFHEFEKRTVFARTWQYVGHASQIPRIGDHITTMVARKPVLVVRAGDGRLHAFYNVCRHRGGPLALKDGHADMLQCRYHGWTYRLDGMLRGVPHFNRTELFDKKDFGLIPVRLEEWQGLLFVHLDPGAEPLERFMAGIAERMAPMRFDDLAFARRVDYDARCNWKVYVDNYIEAYHVPHVHPELCSLYDFQAYRTEVYDWYSLQVGPLSGSDTPYGVTSGEALYYFIYPNFTLNILPGRLQTNIILPVAPDRCRITFHYFYSNLEEAERRGIVNDDVAFSDAVQIEDIEVCERVQEGLESGIYDKGRFSPEMETAVHHFQSLLKRTFARELGS